ncbi:MAG: hypothetical protein CM15mV41_0460 [Caudoviricetes sp.]|nr:MAG: hypothetical protein CM15mV41_0460 [Caudoviricetes sp.]
MKTIPTDDRNFAQLLKFLRTFVRLINQSLSNLAHTLLLLASTKTFLLSLKSKSSLIRRFLFTIWCIPWRSVSLDSPKIDTTESNYVTVSDTAGRSKTRFFYADPDIITQPPEKEINLPSCDVDFILPANALQQLQRAASIINCLICVSMLMVIRCCCL